MAWAARPNGERVRSKNRPFADPEPPGSQFVVLKLSRARTVGSIANSPTTDPEARSLILSITRPFDLVTVVVRNGLSLRHALKLSTLACPSLAAISTIAIVTRRTVIATAEIIFCRRQWRAPAVGMSEAYWPKWVLTSATPSSAKSPARQRREVKTIALVAKLSCAERRA
jgi:hypothetical protein